MRTDVHSLSMNLTNRLTFFLLILLISFSAVLGQAVPRSNFPEANTEASEGQIPVFKNRAEVVLVPVVVRDKKGKIVTGLTKDAFQIEENGKKREISSFEEITPTASVTPTAAPQGYTNIPLDASLHTHLTIAVLDLINTNELQRTDGKDQLIRFFSKDMPRESRFPCSASQITACGWSIPSPRTQGLCCNRSKL